MTYPAAPWFLQGPAVQTVQLLDVDRVRPLIPADLQLVTPFPGKTVGGIYLASYQTGSVLIYNELIAVCGLISYKGKIGAWISHIYVDQPDSVAGGREIWGLPKELAEFEWHWADKPSVQVKQGDRSLCSLRCTWQLPGWSQSLTIPAFSRQGAKLLQFEAQAKPTIHVMGAELQIPTDSPLADLALGQPWLNVYLNPFSLMVKAPTVVAEKTSYSYSLDEQ